jgi:SMODS and SLOG-associating 2TM effector domain 1/SMODS and SLOG-associating 2TM effector domain 3
MPELYDVAETASSEGQHWFKWLTGTALILLVVAAAGGMIDERWAGWMSAVAFAVGTVASTLWIFRRHENEWYDGRAAAESAKSLTFKYAVGGQPYDVENTAATAEYAGALAAIVSELKRLESPVDASADPGDLGDLDRLRAAQLSDRQAVYRDQRIEEQRTWYTRRARDHRGNGRRWQRAMIALYLAGITGAVLKGLGVIDFDLLGLFATLAASVAAWLAAMDYRRIARAYEFAAEELRDVLERSSTMATEAEWSSFVADAEQAMSREHTLWQARRRGKT